jgi:hypothetical protein
VAHAGGQVKVDDAGLENLPAAARFASRVADAGCAGRGCVAGVRFLRSRLGKRFIEVERLGIQSAQIHFVEGAEEEREIEYQTRLA